MSRVIFAPLPFADDMLAIALGAAGLPTDDLREPGRAFFGLSDDHRPIGFIGIEGAGADRLLRSLVVLPGRKRKGFGGLLVAHAEAFARQDGVERLHMLTQTVPDFFRARGYRPVERATAPATIASTAQFAALCPASAAYFVKDIV